jgi:hypothetical protein
MFRKHLFYPLNYQGNMGMSVNLPQELPEAYIDVQS